MSTMQPLRCVVMGEGTLPIQCAQILLEQQHQLLGIVSADPDVVAWAEEHCLFHTQPDRHLAHVLQQTPFDYLFSIVNPVLLSPEILALPQHGAINYHDSPLPKYAGLYASSWALLHQETHHAISWHIIAPSIDTGEILKQVPIAIDADETALTLNAKCYTAAIASFSELVHELATQTITRTAQDLSHRSYFSRRKKPSMGVQLRWQNQADQLDALVRSLHFAPYANPLAVPQFRVETSTGPRLLIVTQLEVLSQSSQSPAGTVTAIREDALWVATATQDVSLKQVKTLHGQDLTIAELVAHTGLQVGDRLPDLTVELARRIDELDGALAKHEAFWVKQFMQMQPSMLPDRWRKPIGASYSPPTVVECEVLDGHLPIIMQPHAADVLTVAFALYVARIWGIDRADIGLSSTALHQSLNGLELFFAAQVPCSLHFDLTQDGEQAIAKLVEHVQQTKDHQTYSRSMIARYPQLAASPALQSESLFAVAVHQANSLSDSTAPLHSDLTLVIAADEQCCRWVYNPQRLDRDTVERIDHQFSAFLATLLARPQQQLADLPLADVSLLSPAERQQVLVDWNATDVEYPQHLRLHDLFEAQVDRTPDAIAVVFGDESLTYQALNRRANQVAHRLQELGIQPDLPVGICIERSLEMVVGLLAILKAGGAYVPLDPTYPADRLAHILTDAQISVVLTQAKLLPLLPDRPTLCLDTLGETIACESTENPVSLATAKHLAYIIYTSGSTGKPKGVLIEHQGAVNTILDMNRRFGVTATDRVLAVCSLNFDLSVYDIFGLLAAGGTIVIPQPAIAPDLNHWHTLLYEQQITIWNSAPPVMQMFAGHLVDHARRLPASLRLVLLSGDWIPIQLPDLIRQLAEPSIELISLGGATEASIWSIFYPIASVDSTWKSIPYGRPLANQQFYILDEQLNPVAPGTVGELLIGGDGVARGYHNRPDLNATKFIADPFRQTATGRLYRTGDLGRHLPDGNIEFLGRIDHQVKIRGFRVEIGEIETVLAQHPAVRETAVVAREDTPGNPQLVAYLVLHSSDPPNLNDLRCFLQTKLPDYMVPAALVPLEALPLTPNGKLDRKALPAPEVSVTIAPARDSVEQQLVEIWQQVLGVSAIGIQDNFFQLGGNSLVAVRLWSHIEKAFQRELPLTMLFQAPTIAQLADRLRQHQLELPRCPSLVVMQAGQPASSMPPLFCIHVLGRGLKFYRPLIQHLDPQQPIYGLSTHIAGEPFTLEEVAPLAAHYVEQIRILQPHGPYLLSGISFGGLVAYEIAQQLTAQGEQIALLALLDTRLANAEQLAKRSEKYAVHWQQFSQLGYRYVVQKLKQRTVGQTQKLTASLQEKAFRLSVQVHQGIRQPLPAVLQDFVYEQENIRLTESYHPQPYGGNVVLFKASEQYVRVGSHLSSELGWRELITGDLAVHEIPGTHLGMLQEPFVQTLARFMRRYIAKALSAPAASRVH